MGFGCAILYEMLLSHKNHNDKDSCYPSYKTLADELGMSKTTVGKYLTKLSENGYLLIESGDKESSNHYYFPKSSLEVTNYTKKDVKELFDIDIKEYIDDGCRGCEDYSESDPF